AHELENGKRGKSFAIDHGSYLFRKNPHEIAGKPAAGNVRHRVNVDLREQREKWLDVDRRRGQQRFPERRAELRHAPRKRLSRRCCESTPRKAVAVAVKPGRFEADDDVAGTHAAAVDELFALGNADAESRQIVFTGFVETRQLRRFSTDE